MLDPRAEFPDKNAEKKGGREGTKYRLYERVNWRKWPLLRGEFQKRRELVLKWQA